jgi:site-specific DNA-methyltransferase (adenine-specific)
VAAVVIGDVDNPGHLPLPLARQLWEAVGAGSGLKLLYLIEDEIQVQNKVSRIWGETKGHATERDCVLVLAHKGAEAIPAAGESRLG